MEKPALPGKAVRPDEDRLVLLGILTKPQGLKGGVRMMAQFDNSDDFENLKTDRLFLKPTPASAGLRPRSAEYREVTLAEYDEHHRFLVLYFDGVTDINDAEIYRNLEVYVYEDELWDLEDGRFYAFQLVGLELYDATADAVVGTVKELRPAAQDYLVIQSDSGEFYVPYVPEIVTSVDLQQQRITAKLPPGIDDLK